MEALALKSDINDWVIVRGDDRFAQGISDTKITRMCGFRLGKPERPQKMKYGISVYVGNRLVSRDPINWLSELKRKLESCEVIPHWGGVAVEDHIAFRRAARAGYNISFQRAETTSDLEQIFNGLVKNWKEATGGYSVTARRYAHPSYQAILVLKEDVVPLILRELQQRPDWWFEALKALTKENPVTAGATFEEAVNAWIDWGKRNHRIP